MLRPFRDFKNSLVIFLFALSLTSTVSYAAVDCSSYGAQIDDPRYRNSIIYLLCPLQSAINIGLYFVGAILIVLVLYGAIKAVTASGDPKQLEGAKMTWSYAIFGFVIILFSITILTIGTRLLGSETSPLDVVGTVDSGLSNFYQGIEEWWPF